MKRTSSMHNVPRGEGDINLSSLRTSWQEDTLSEDSYDLLRRDEEAFLHQSLSTPCLNVIERAEGPFLIDQDGRRTYDFHGNAVHQVGYGHPEVVKAVQEQLVQLPFSPRRYTNEQAVTLAERLLEIAPTPLSKVLFAPGATSAVGMALKLARIATGRHKTMSMWESFHGASLDALSVGGEAHFRRQIGPLLPGAIHIPPLSTYRPLWEGASLDDRQLAAYIEYTMEQDGEIGAFIMEPIRNTDVQLPSQAFMNKLRELCTKHGVQLIFDETATAFGRTGKWFAFQHYDVVPDMVIIGKGLGGGVFPMAGLLAADNLNVATDTSIGHYTHEKSPVGAAASLAMIHVIQQEQLLEKTATLSQLMREQLESLASRYEQIGDCRIIGLLCGVELVTDRNTKEKATNLAERVLYNCLSRGLSFKLSKGNVLQLCPPLTITKEQLLEALNLLELALQDEIEKETDSDASYT
ncbi:4-aminobutyrate aminotransferase [Pontibacillus halophilus JSM 076056 = DSM 19796]|uniref:4-aminobutyrate aminotransferase n=2 Tax=Pontibacillus TaxID=289201 RepID=A0A0A5IDY0_9BACI|nr:4-aminobutyrate aminotransferase [Pontibacillus halophilus JSM 076056 = DSM 19796]